MVIIIWNIWEVKVFILLYVGRGMKDMGVL